MRQRPTLLLPLLVTLTCSAALAEPFLPTTDSQVLEKLPYKATDPVFAELRAERLQLNQEPDNLQLALRMARRYIELGRVNGDPRYAGYAQAALMRWWDLERPPTQVLLMRATLKQRVHDFNGALIDLDAVLKSNPSDAQARLTRATVLQVQGRYPAALEECELLRRLAQEIVVATCLTSIGSVTGHLQESYARLKLALELHPEADPSLRSWALTGMAEMAARAGMARESESDFRAALALDDSDFYLLGAYADFLLDEGRPAEVERLLADKTRADPLFLRYVLALKAQGSPQLPAMTEQLRARFEASRLRGDRVHLREEARFTLHVLNDVPRALQLANENFGVQREVADVRILLEAASAAGDAPTLAAVSRWVGDSKLQDTHIEQLMHPDTGLLRKGG